MSLFLFFPFFPPRPIPTFQLPTWLTTFTSITLHVILPIPSLTIILLPFAHHLPSHRPSNPIEPELPEEPLDEVIVPQESPRVEEEKEAPCPEESVESVEVSETTEIQIEQVDTTQMVSQTEVSETAINISIEAEEASPKSEITVHEHVEIVSAELPKQEDVSAEIDFVAPAPEASTTSTTTTIDAFENLITEIDEAVQEEITEDVTVPIIEPDEEAVTSPTVTADDFEIIQKFEEVIEESFEQPEEAHMTEESPVKERPSFSVELSNIEATEGQPVRFEVVVKGEPMPQLEWLLDGEVINDSSIYRVESGPEGRSALVLQEAFPEDEGEYECRAINEVGTATTKADLYVQGRHLMNELCWSFIGSLYCLFIFTSFILRVSSFMLEHVILNFTFLPVD